MDQCNISVFEIPENENNFGKENRSDEFTKEDNNAIKIREYK